MKKILFIHEHSPGNKKAFEFAVSLAAKMHAGILAVTTVAERAFGEKVIAEKSSGQIPESQVTNLPGDGQVPVSSINMAGMNLQQVAHMINRENIWMIIKAAADPAPSDLDMQTLLNRICCPILLIPADWVPKDLQRVVYLADLRYCRLDIVRYLTLLASACQAAVSVAHLTMEGLVHIDETYAHRLFEEQVCKEVRYERLYLNYTRERDVAKAGDVLTSGMQQDLLVMAGNGYHYQKLIGPRVTGSLPTDILVPALIFPG